MTGRNLCDVVCYNIFDMTKEIRKTTNNLPLKIAEYVAYLLVFIVPLCFNESHFYIFNSSKLMILFGLVSVMVIFFSWGKWKEKNFKFRVSLLSVSLTFFILGLIVSSLFGVDPINSFFGWGQVVPLFAIIALAVFSFLLASLIRRDDRVIRNLLCCIFCSGIFVMILFYTGLPGQMGKTEGSTLGNSSYLGSYLLFVIASGVSLLIYRKKVWQRFFVSLGLVFLLFNPIFINKAFLVGDLSLSQIINNPVSILGIANGATLGLALSFLLAVFLFFSFSNKKVWKIMGVSFVAILFLVVFWAGQALVKEGSSINKIFTQEKSENRFIAWNIAKQGFTDNPILGIGHNNYIYNFEKYYNPDFYKKGNAVERFIEPHNVVWGIASNGGIVGLVGYLGLLMSLFITLSKVRGKDDDKRVGLILASLVFGYFIQNLFVFDTTSTYLSLFVIVAIGLGLSEYKEWQLSPRYSTVNKSLIILAVILSFLSLKIFYFDPSTESKRMNKILNETKNMGDFASIRDGLSSRSYFGGVMDYTYQAEKLFKIYQKSLYKVDEENKEVFLKELDSLVLNLEELIEKQPNFGDSHLVTAELLNLYMLAEAKNGEIIKLDGKNLNEKIWAKSFGHLSKYFELHASSPQGLMAFSQLYMIKGDFEKSKEYIKSYLSLAPEYKEGYDFARGLLKIKPDHELESFIDQMQKKWIHP